MFGISCGRQSSAPMVAPAAVKTLKGSGVTGRIIQALCSREAAAFLPCPVDLREQVQVPLVGALNLIILPFIVLELLIRLQVEKTLRPPSGAIQPPKPLHLRRRREDAQLLHLQRLNRRLLRRRSRGSRPHTASIFHFIHPSPTRSPSNAKLRGSSGISPVLRSIRCSALVRLQAFCGQGMDVLFLLR